MDDKIKLNDEFHEKIKKFMKKFTTEELMEWRNKLIDLKMLDNDMLVLFNTELMERACERIEINNKKSK